MRRILRALAVIAVACGTAFSAVTPAAAHDLGSDRFQVTLRNATEDYVDNGPKGPSVGDYFVSQDKVFHQGDRVGRLAAHCDVTRAGPQRFAFACTVTLYLRHRGQIALQGLFAFRRGKPGGPLAELAITGGTRWYAHASGTATLVELRGEPARLRIDMR
jgi:hypothetical protein